MLTDADTRGRCEQCNSTTSPFVHLHELAHGRVKRYCIKHKFEGRVTRRLTSLLTYADVC
jgi:hypothetical protein